ncbi:hypothetical protein [Acetobacterium sp.]|uniref:ferritin-like domain-containing protein n=1 Tax=Acetobacterium sp. TaxID=1872094 RepID=UPI000CBB57E2|nr:hypothetical protein [Acetobacterium sp.]MDO9493634.1 hypothetical protein [Acetobacterium sp.]PKM74873.1 MAG: hypothetical protein CVU92_04230 [Firmicutes bacterium HGW-Firmicutes-17]
MKRLSKLLTVLLLAFTLVGSVGVVMAEENDFGSAGALADDNLTLEEMLTYAIQDEYAAEAEYAKIIATYGQVRPYSNIVNAETKHIAALTPLFEANSFETPVNDAASRVILPASLKESYAIGVQAEIMNIDMYNRFLTQELPDSVRTVFESLRKASESHLVAFQRKAK